MHFTETIVCIFNDYRISILGRNGDWTNKKNENDSNTVRYLSQHASYAY